MITEREVERLKARCNALEDWAVAWRALASARATLIACYERGSRSGEESARRAIARAEKRLSELGPLP